MIPTVVHFLVGTAVVGGLLWATSVLARRFGRRGVSLGGGDDRLRIVARRSLTKGSTLVRVSVEDRDILLGASSKGVEMLCDLPKTAVATAPMPAPASLPRLSLGGFAGVLDWAMLRRRDPQA